MRLPRITIRNWIAIIVVVAFSMSAIVGVSRLKQAQARFREIVVHHLVLLDEAQTQADKMNQRSKSLLAQIETLEEDSNNASSGPATLEGLRSDLSQARKELADFAKEGAYHKEMIRKYEEAARYPWRTMTPEPAKP